ncbi:MAG: hypothetical protein BTN85_0817 [Candidatus Methanohalarchaeum thermophilum]|uniref:Uncharacterized protein n=1 Tax=Methanohalarchaeum thermophilum TaxID=1903181 RepID=A0A1Q6DVF9_METT1|nr:MAG: hypothetical protein BTN85_0817 [Candidatus Methanohalarchaeum thermophilum]
MIDSREKIWESYHDFLENLPEKTRKTREYEEKASDCIDQKIQ